MSNYDVKQVIVMRKDLNMRKGKMVAQGAHASMAVILNMMSKSPGERIDGSKFTVMSLYAEGYVDAWLSGKFAKICVSVDTEEELLAVYNGALNEGIPAALITDAGFTEFNGVPTNTCCAIGPWRREDLDKITGHLKLL